MSTQAEKAATFQALHQGPGAFIIPNPWDAGSARLLAAEGYRALASTSAGCAFSAGVRDNAVSRSDMLDHLTRLVAATDLPVSADLGNGFGHSPEDAAQAITLAAQTGVVGASIEDATGDPDEPIYEFGLAVARVRAAAQAAHALPFPFTLTARAENYLIGRRDLADTVARLQAYEAAGADVLYAPGLTSAAEISAVVGVLHRPVNVLAGLTGMRLGQAELAQIGVRRISVGSALARAAYGALLRAAREMREEGTFAFTEDAVGFAELERLLPPS